MEKTSTENLKRIVMQEKVIFGTTTIMKKLKQGKIKKVFLASNVPKEVESDIHHNASISNAEIEKLDMANYDFGMLFKRPHPVLALAILRE